MPFSRGRTVLRKLRYAPGTARSADHAVRPNHGPAGRPTVRRRRSRPCGDRTGRGTDQTVAADRHDLRAEPDVRTEPDQFGCKNR